MVAIDKEIPNGRFLPTAYVIAVKSAADFPNIKHFLENILKDTDIKMKHIGKRFAHHHLTKKFQDYKLLGSFMSYFVRKHLSNQLNVALTDFHTEQILKKPGDYIIGTKPDMHRAIEKHYEIYTNRKTRAMEIIKSIKMVTFSQRMHLRCDELKTDYYVNEDNLREVVKYFQKLPYRTVEFNSKLGCKYFHAMADLLFDNEVMYDIRVSTFYSLSRYHKTINIIEFYKMIVSAFGFFKKTRKAIKTFKIYNPLLGCEYSIKLNDIDFDQFEAVIKKDVAAYCCLKECEIVNVPLDLGSFPTNECTEDPGKPKINAVSVLPKKSILKVAANSDLVLYEHFANFDINESDDSQVHKNTNKKHNRKDGTDRIRKWERISIEETALLSSNRGKKNTKREVKNSKL